MFIRACDVKKLEKQYPNPVSLKEKDVHIPQSILKLLARSKGAYKIYTLVYLSLEDLIFIFSNRSPNRDLDRSKVVEMTEDIQKNHWVYNNGDTICINEFGRINDGQNRIAAFILLGIGGKFSIAVNVKDDDVRKYGDKGKSRNSRDRLTMGVRKSGVQNLPPMLLGIFTNCFVNNPLGRKFNSGKSKLGVEIQDYFLEHSEHSENLKHTLMLYEQLMVAKESIKKVEAFWANIFRAMPYFKAEGRIQELENFILLVFHSRENTKNEWDGWAKLAKDAIDIYDRAPDKGKGTAACQFVCTINMYLRKYFDKIPCPVEIRSKRLVANLTEHFPLKEEIDFINGGVKQQKEDVSKKNAIEKAVCKT